MLTVALLCSGQALGAIALLYALPLTPGQEAYE